MGRGVAAGLLGITAESLPEAGQGGGTVRSWPLPVGLVWDLCYGPTLSSYLQGQARFPAPSLLPYLSHKPGNLWEVLWI